MVCGGLFCFRRGGGRVFVCFLVAVSFMFVLLCILVAVLLILLLLLFLVAVSVQLEVLWFFFTEKKEKILIGRSSRWTEKNTFAENPELSNVSSVSPTDINSACY